jgi:hypothetical protein
MPTCHPQRSIFLTFLWHFIWRIFIYYIQYILTFIPAIFLTCYRVFTFTFHLLVYVASILALFLAFYLASTPWHSIQHILWLSFPHSIANQFWHSLSHPVWHLFRHSTWHSFCQVFWHYFWHVFSPAHAQTELQFPVWMPRSSLWVSGRDYFTWAGTCCEVRARWCPQWRPAGIRTRTAREGGTAPLLPSRDPHLAGAEQTETMKTRFHHQTMANVRHNDTESRVDKHQRPQQSPIPTSLKITARQNHGTSRNLRNFHAAGVYGKTATTFLILHPTWSLRPCQTSCKSVCTPRGKWRMNVQCIIIYLSTILQGANRFGAKPTAWEKTFKFQHPNLSCRNRNVVGIQICRYGSRCLVLVTFRFIFPCPRTSENCMFAAGC